MIVQELWSNRDERDLDIFLAAERDGDLVRALFAVEGSLEPTIVEGRRLLSDWSSRVRDRLASSSLRSASVGPVRAAEQAVALSRVLGDELGFKGDTDDYHNPRNSLLHEVLTRRRGMPILLSCVWIDVGRRAGIPVTGVGLPGHFIARVGGRSGTLVDPFAAGARLSIADCKQRVNELSGGKLSWQDDFLRDSRPDEILERALQNLLNSYQGVGDGAGSFRVASFLAALRPDSPERHLKKAEIAAELGAHDLAQRGYSELIEAFPESPESETAWERLEREDPPALVN